MKYFKVPTTQAITNTCNNINWNEFSGCSRLKLSDRRGGVAAHFDTGPPRPPLPTPLTLPYLISASCSAPSDSSWQALADARAHELVQAAALPALPTTLPAPWVPLISAGNFRRSSALLRNGLVPHTLLFGAALAHGVGGILYFPSVPCCNNHVFPKSLQCLPRSWKDLNARSWLWGLNSYQGCDRCLWWGWHATFCTVPGLIDISLFQLMHNIAASTVFLHPSRLPPHSFHWLHALLSLTAPNQDEDFGACIQGPI